MTTWELLSSHSSSTGDAWDRLNNLNTGGTGSLLSDVVISFDVTPTEVVLNMMVPEYIFSTTPSEIIFSTESNEIEFSTTPADYQFSVTIPEVTLEA